MPPQIEMEMSIHRPHSATLSHAPACPWPSRDPPRSTGPNPTRPDRDRCAGERDVPVSEVFTPAMWAELKALMTTQGWDVAATEQLWASDFAGRKIISGFMKDKELGEKRLASMPDRVTNTINTLGDAGKVHRPTVISCYDGDMSSMAAWWKEWRTFMFETQAS